MNGWHAAATAAARDRTESYRRQATHARLVHLAQASAEAGRPGALRRSAAGLLRRLADALAPQAEDAMA